MSEELYYIFAMGCVVSAVTMIGAFFGFVASDFPNQAFEPPLTDENPV
jgi:hypothetical protein